MTVGAAVERVTVLVAVIVLHAISFHSRTAESITYLVTGKARKTAEIAVRVAIARVNITFSVVEGMGMSMHEQIAEIDAAFQ